MMHGGGAATLTGVTTFLTVVTFAVLLVEVVPVDAQTITEPLVIVEPTLTLPLVFDEVHAACAEAGAINKGAKIAKAISNFFIRKK